MNKHFVRGFEKSAFLAMAGKMLGGAAKWAVTNPGKALGGAMKVHSAKNLATDAASATAAARNSPVVGTKFFQGGF